MEARLFRAVALTAVLASLGASHRTQNFIISASTPELAREMASAAETYRRDLAIHWLGKQLPDWPEPCPITIQSGPELGAGGATTFMFDQGKVFGWRMSVQGSRERILDSVLPHEISHTVFASHFRRPLPRWADEGACTTIEHASERSKQHSMLVSFLKTGRGIPFDRMFAMKEYPHDVMPLYSQGYSTARYLIAQGGPRKFMEFLATGFQLNDWAQATEQHYGFTDLGDLQNSWLAWVREGSPQNIASRRAPERLLADATPVSRPAEPAAAAEEYRPGGTTRLTASPPPPPQAPRESEAEPTERLRDPGRGWYARTSRGAAARETEGAIRREATHPQPFEPARQIILEWRRPE